MISKIALVTLALFACALNFSISISQLFLAITILLGLVELRKTENRKYLAEIFRQNKIRYLYIAFIFWILWRIVHVFLSQQPLEELYIARELWLLIIPILLIYFTQKANSIYIIIIALLVSGASTGIYLILRLYINEFDPLVFRTGGFDTYHHLTYSGTVGFTSLLGYFLFIKKYHKVGFNYKSGIILLLALGSTTGLVLTISRMAYFAFFLISIFFIIIFMKRKFFFVLPIIIVLPVFIFNHSLILQKMVDQVINPNISFTGLARIQLWQAGLKMFLANPWLGTGNADFPIIYENFKVVGAVENASNGGTHLHSELLHMLVTFGSVGLSMLLAFYFLPFIEAFKVFWTKRKMESFVIMCIPIYMMVIGLTQCNFIDDEVQMTFWLAIGILYAEVTANEN